MSLRLARELTDLNGIIIDCIDGDILLWNGALYEV